MKGFVKSSYNDFDGKPFISSVEECPRCFTINIIIAENFVEEDFVCSHCGWYEEIYFDEYIKDRGAVI